MVPQYTAIPAMGGGWPYKGMGLRGLMGKKTRKPREEEHTKVSSRGFHALAGGERSFYLPMATSKTEIQSFRRFTLIKYEKIHI